MDGPPCALEGKSMNAVGSLTHGSKGTARRGLEMLLEHMAFLSCLFGCREAHLRGN